MASNRINAIAPYFSKRAINEITTKINRLENTKEPRDKNKATHHTRLKEDAKDLSRTLKEIRSQAHNRIYCHIKSTVESFDATLSDNFLELKKQLTHRFHCILNVAEIYIDLLQNNAKKSEAHKFVIASVPSSTAGNQIHPISLVAQYVATATGNIDGTRLITRNESIKSVHSGGQTGLEHRKTGLAIDRSLNGKTVLIIDDIVNTGNSFRAVVQELKRVCPDATFVCLALARTVNRCTIKLEDSGFEQLLQKEIKLRKENGANCFKTTFNDIETATWHYHPTDASKNPKEVKVSSSRKYRGKITLNNIIVNYETRSAYKECFARIESHLKSHDRDHSDDGGDDNTPIHNPSAKKSSMRKASSYAGRTASSGKSGGYGSSDAASSIATVLAHSELGGEQIFDFDSILDVEPDEGYIETIKNMTEEEIAHTEIGEIEAYRGCRHVEITDLCESHDIINTPEIPPHSGESSLATTPALSRLTSADSTGRTTPDFNLQHLYLFNPYTHREIKPVIEENAQDSMSVVKATDDDSCCNKLK